LRKCIVLCKSNTHLESFPRRVSPILDWNFVNKEEEYSLVIDFPVSENDLISSPENGRDHFPRRSFWTENQHVSTLWTFFLVFESG
jgi:hypothetical protein